MSHTEATTTPIHEDPNTTTVLDVVVYLLLSAQRDGWEIFESKIHFMCYQIMGWSLAWTGEKAFDASVLAVEDGFLIQEVADFLAPLGLSRDEVFTFADCVVAGIVTMAPGNPNLTETT